MNKLKYLHLGMRTTCRSANFSSLILLFVPLLLASCTVGRQSLRGGSDGPSGGRFSQLYTEGDDRAIEAAAHPRTLDQQSERARAKQLKLEKELEEVEDDDDKEDIEERLELVEFAVNWIDRTRKSHPTSKDILSVNLQAERILNAVEASESEAKNDNFFDATTNFIFTMVFGHSIPAISGDDRNTPLTIRGAERESSFLFNPGSGEFFAADQLAAMTPDEVSEMDVSYQHPGWYRQDEKKRMRRGRIKKFESWMESGVRAVLRSEGDVAAAGSWDMGSATKVLFMDEIYKSATSAKGKTKDAFGVEWKIKWGDEVQAEVVSSRLYLHAGGKMTDLVFAGDPGPEGMVLVLNKQGKYEDEKAEEGAEREPETVEQLAETLHDFYGFDVTPYIYNHGVITAQNVGTVLRNLPSGGESKYQRDKLIGRHWVSFREYLLELRPDGFVRRENGSRMSDVAANNDRVARGSYLLSLWMSNRDVKDDNNKAFYLKRPGAGSNGRIIDYREGHHDMGVTLGTMGSSAEINAMETDDDFMRTGIFGRNFRFSQTYIYKPAAWKRATWADCRWMARHIAGLSVGEIREAVAASKWPDFMQEALAYKLLNRRNRIAEMYDLTDELDEPVAMAPSIAVNLRSRSEIERAEQKYRLTSGSLAAELRKIGAGADYVETLVYEGQVADSRGSAVIRLLVQQRYPAGLDDRYRRMTDQPPRPLR